MFFNSDNLEVNMSKERWLICKATMILALEFYFYLNEKDCFLLYHFACFVWYLSHIDLFLVFGLSSENRSQYVTKFYIKDFKYKIICKLVALVSFLLYFDCIETHITLGWQVKINLQSN